MIQIFGFFVSFASSLFAYCLALFGRKFTVATAAVLAYTTVFIVFIGCMNEGIILIKNLINIPPWLAYGLGVFIPSNFNSISSAIVSSHICSIAYDAVKDKIQLAATSS